ncbi:MAG: hypothetical protein U0792_12475 [Gemmataceae bacterium]
MMFTPWLIVGLFCVGMAVCILGGGSIAIGEHHFEFRLGRLLKIPAIP